MLGVLFITTVRVPLLLLLPLLLKAVLPLRHCTGVHGTLGRICEVLRMLQFVEIDGTRLMLLSSTKNKVLKRSKQPVKFSSLPNWALLLMLHDGLRCNSDVVMMLTNPANSEADMMKVTYQMSERGSCSTTNVVSR